MNYYDEGYLKEFLKWMLKGISFFCIFSMVSLIKLFTIFDAILSSFLASESKMETFFKYLT